MLLVPVGLMASAPVVAAGLLLDSIAATVVGAYGMRKLRAGYAGPAIQVRRSSDNAVQDIGFAASSDVPGGASALGTARGGVLDVGALLAFCGSGNGSLSKWYDQSGGAQHLVQTAAANQPQIVASGASYTLPNVTARPGMQLIAGSTTNLGCASFPLAGASAYACISVASRTASGSAGNARLALFDAGGNDYQTPNAIFIYQDTASTITAYHGANLSQAPLGTALAQIASVFSGTAHVMTVDGSAGSSVAASNTLPTGGALVFGAAAAGGTESGSPWDGAMAEAIIVSGALSAGDQAAIRASQKTYYGTP